MQNFSEFREQWLHVLAPPQEYLMCGDAQGLSGCPSVFVSWARWGSVAAGSSGSLDKP